MGVGEGDDRDGIEKDRGTGAGEREIGRETGWERERGKRDGVTGEKEKKLETQKIHGISSCCTSLCRME